MADAGNAFGLDLSQYPVAGGNAAPPAAAPATQKPGVYPMVPVHPSPDGRGDTNLSDEDYYKMMGDLHSQSSAPATPPPSPAKTDGSGQNAFGLDLAQYPEANPKPPVSDKSIPEQVVGSTASAIHGIPQGIVGRSVADYVDAATQAPIRMVTGLQGPISAFNEGLDAARAKDAQADQYPIANVGGQLMGGIGAGAAMAPSLAYKASSAAPTMLQRAGDVASYIGKNAAMGGLVSAANGGNPMTGAALGGGLAAAAPAIEQAIRIPMKMAGSVVDAGKRLISSGAQDTSVANVLGHSIDPAQIQTSTVGPLDLAQATNNPNIAAKVRYAQGPFADQATALRDAQSQAVRDQIAQVGTPAPAAEASDTAVNAIRDISGLTKQHERALWNAPALTDHLFPTSGVKDAVTSTMAAIAKDDPGLMLGRNGDITAAVNGIQMLPQNANLQNINSFIGVLKSVARRPPPDNARAGALASRLLSGLGKSLDDTVTASGAPQSVQDAYQAAKGYTAERSSALGTQDMRALTTKNPAGLYNVDASEGLKRFFNFSNGSPEGPASIQDLAKFAKRTKDAWLLGPNEAEKLGFGIDQLREGARSYVAQALTQAARVGEGQTLNPKTLQDFLRSNKNWFRSSGIFDRPQTEAADRLMDYASMLRRTESLNAQSNSATQGRMETAKTFIDEIMSPWARRTLELGALAAGGEAHGGVGAMAAGAGSAAFEYAVAKAETAMRETMSAALFNPQVAKDLMMRNTPGNAALLSQQTRELMRTLQISAQSDVAPHFLGRQPEPALQVGH